MPANSNIFRQPKPTEPRLRIDLPCRLCVEAFRVTARVCNINHSGMQIALPTDAADIDFRVLGSVEIDGVGTFDVVPKWRRNGRLGLMFADKHGAREPLDTWFRATGQFP